MPIFDQRADQVETTLKEVETASVCRTDALKQAVISVVDGTREPGLSAPLHVVVATDAQECG